MEQNHKRLWRSVVAMVLTFTLVFGTAGTAFAYADTNAVDEDDTFNYVSLGASQTNGYGMRGYLDDEAYLDPDSFDKETANVFGYNRSPENAYPTMMAEYLEKETGKTVNLSQLAMSGMRVEEIRVLLDDTYNGDAYTKWRYTDGYNWFGQAGGTDKMRAEYKDAITKADMITLEIGVNNFGTYPMSQILVGSKMFDDDISDIADPDKLESYNMIKSMLVSVIASNTDTDAAFIESVADTFAYAYVSYKMNFDAVIEKIRELNPDVQIVVLSIPNIMEGVKATLGETEIPLGDLFGYIVDLGNMYISTESPYIDEYLFAATNEAATFLDEIAAYNGNPQSLSTDMKDCFDLYDDELKIYTRVKAAFGGDTTSAQFEEALYNAYDVVAAVCHAGANEKNIDLSAMLSGKSSAAEDEMMQYIDENVDAAIDAAKSGKKFEFVFDKTLLEDPVVVTALSMGVISNLGDTFFVHPNASGHKEVLEVILRTLDYGTTGPQAADVEMSEQLNEVMDFALTLSTSIYDSQQQIFNKFKKAVNNLDEYAKREQDNFINSVQQTLESSGINEELNNVDNEIKELRNSIKRFKSTVGTMATAIKNENIAKIEEASAAIDEEIKKLNKAADALEASIREATKQAKELGVNNSDLKLVAAKMYRYVTLARATAEIMKSDSRKATYALDDKACYVALGDESVSYKMASGSYARKLAKELGLVNNVSFFDEGEAGMRIEDLRYILDETYQPDEYGVSLFGAPDSDKLIKERANKIDKIKSADLITVGFNNNTLLDIAFKQMLNKFIGKECFEIDWSRYLDESTIAELEVAMDDVEVKLQSATEEISNFVLDMEKMGAAGRIAVESYLYGYIGYYENYQKAIDKIHEINPDAKIVLAGQFNAFSEMNLIVDGEKIAIGEYIGYLVDLMNMQQSGYAMLSGNASYVDVSKVEIENQIYKGDLELVPFVSQVFFKGTDSLKASSAGHNYIKNQIMTAINVVDTDTEIVMNKMAGLYDLLHITTADLDDAEKQIKETRDAYESLAEDQKSKVDAELVKLLDFYEEDFEYVKAFAVGNSNVANLKAKLPTKTKLAVSWTGVNAAEKYIVKIYRNGKLIKTANTTAKSYTLKNITRGCTYKVAVQPVRTYLSADFVGAEKKTSVTSKLDKANIAVKKAGANAKVSSKDQNSTGFQVWVAKDKKFKKNVIKKTFKTNGKALKNKAVALKKGTNYIKVRAYTTIGGKTVYGAWSSVKTIKR